MKLQQHCTLEMNTYDDFLDEDYHQELLSILTGWEFPWFYQNTLTAGSLDVSALGFNHWLSNENDPEFSELVLKMQEKELGKKNTDNVLNGILDRHPELTIPLKYVKYPDRIRYKKRPKRKISTRNSY